MSIRVVVRYVRLCCWLAVAAAASGQAPPALPVDDVKAPGGPFEAQPPRTVDELLALTTEAVRRAEKGEDSQPQDLEAASGYLDELQRLAPTNIRAAFLRARAAVVLGRSKEALATIQEYAKSREGQNDWEAHKILGLLYMQGAWHRQARDCLQLASGLNANDAEIQVALAVCEFHLGRKSEAVTLIENAIKLPSAELKHLDTFVEVLVANNELERAYSVAVQSLELTKAHAGQQRGNARALQLLDTKYAVLDGVIEKAVAKAPTNAELYARWARYAQERADLGQLLAVHLAFIRVQQGIKAGAQPLVPLLLESTRLNLLLDRPDDARTALDEVDRLDPANARAAELRAVLAQPTTRPATQPAP